MTTLPQAARFSCPSLADVREALFALLPRGRAWQTHDTGPREGSVLYGFWSALADVLHYAGQRWCDLREEFFCATANETRAEWLAEYGLPDACDPFPDLCSKVAAQGGQRCEYFVDRATRAGWTVFCEEPRGVCGVGVGAPADGWDVAFCGFQLGAGNLGCTGLGAVKVGTPNANLCGFQLGCSFLGSNSSAGPSKTLFCGFQLGGSMLGCEGLGALGKRRIIPVLLFRVDLEHSPAFQAAYETKPLLGSFKLGNPLGCDPDIGALKCLIDRIAPAHARVEYELIPPTIYLIDETDAALTDEGGSLLIGA